VALVTVRLLFSGGKCVEVGERRDRVPKLLGRIRGQLPMNREGEGKVESSEVRVRKWLLASVLLS